MKFLKTDDALINVAMIDAILLTPRYGALNGNTELSHWVVEVITCNYSADLKRFDTEDAARKYFNELATTLDVEVLELRP